MEAPTGPGARGSRPAGRRRRRRGRRRRAGAPPRAAAARRRRGWGRRWRWCCRRGRVSARKAINDSSSPHQQQQPRARPMQSPPSPPGHLPVAPHASMYWPSPLLADGAGYISHVVVEPAPVPMLTANPAVCASLFIYNLFILINSLFILLFIWSRPVMTRQCLLFKKRFDTNYLALAKYADISPQ